MRGPTEEFAHMWEWFSAHCRTTSPLYERISLAVARDHEVLELVQAAPPSAHLPPALLAAVHYLILEGSTHPLADVYAGRSDADPGPLFLDFFRSRQRDVMALLAVRHIQTNECGRSAVIGPGLTWVASELRGPYSLVDVGASAGLNLLCDRYRMEYGTHGTTGALDAAVKISCRVIGGHPPIAAHLPPLASRIGIDRSPIDLRDPDDARWLLACVWPDTDRLERTAAAIHLAEADPPEVVRGDATAALPAVLAALPPGIVPIVVTTWAFAYLSLEDRATFVGLLDEASQRGPIAWLSAEGVGTVETFAAEAAGAARDEDQVPDVLGAMIFEHGRRRAQLLAFAQEHGQQLDWRAP
jgi:hypothetical protein